jgi:hypothetical protein
MVRGAPIKKRHGCYGKLGDEVEGGGLAGGLGEVVLAAEREAISTLRPSASDNRGGRARGNLDLAAMSRPN